MLFGLREEMAQVFVRSGTETTIRSSASARAVSKRDHGQRPRDIAEERPGQLRVWGQLVTMRRVENSDSMAWLAAT